MAMSPIGPILPYHLEYRLKRESIYIPLTTRGTQRQGTSLPSGFRMNRGRGGKPETQRNPKVDIQAPPGEQAPPGGHGPPQHGNLREAIMSKGRLFKGGLEVRSETRSEARRLNPDGDATGIKEGTRDQSGEPQPKTGSIGDTPKTTPEVRNRFHITGTTYYVP